MIQKIVEPSKPQFDIINSDKQVNLFLAGQGGGKTFCAGVVSGKIISNFPKAHGFIAANTYTQLSDSTLFRIRNVWKEDFGWTEWTKSNKSGCYCVDINPPANFNTDGHEYDSYHGKICFKWGTVIYKGSLDNYKAHDGKEFAWALLDETKDTKEEAVKEVILGRLREPGMTTSTGEPWNPLFIFTSPAKVQWLNEWFSLDEFASEITAQIYSDETYFKKEIDNKFVTISSTYHNAKNLPENYIENQKKNMHSALQDMLIYGNPFSQSGGEFYKCFKRDKQVRNIAKEFPAWNNHGRAYNPSLPIHLTFDFNVNPYMSAGIWQVIELSALTDKVMHEFTCKYFKVAFPTLKLALKIDEICLKNPLNTTPATCKEFARRYNFHSSGLFIYGDPAGDHEDTRVEKRDEKKYNDFRLIMTELKAFRPQLRTEKAAPPVVMRGNFINTCFENYFEGIIIIVDERCKYSINDYIYLKEASDGRKAKELVKDEITKVSYQKYGHCSDHDDYLLCRIFSNEFSKYQRGNDSAKLSSSKPTAKHGY